MSDYTSTYTEGTGDTIDTSDFSTEFDAIETAIATKLDTDSDTATNFTIGSGFGGGALIAGTKQTGTGASARFDFTSIPSWVKRITVSFAGVSTSASSVLEMELGDSGGFDTTADYVTTYAYFDGSSVLSSDATTDHFIIASSTVATNSLSGHIRLTNPDGNIWVIDGVLGNRDAAAGLSNFITSGTKTLSNTLDRVALVASAGNFDAGTVNILYEG